MTTQQKVKILQNIVRLEGDIDTLKQARLEVIQTGYASATLSSSGGSKSYTRIDIDKMTSTIKELQKELAAYRNMLMSGSGLPYKQIYHTWY